MKSVRLTCVVQRDVRLSIDDLNDTRTRQLKGAKETTMTVRAILDTKGHHIVSVEPEAKLSAAVKILGERKIGAVLVMSNGGVSACRPRSAAD